MASPRLRHRRYKGLGVRLVLSLSESPALKALELERTTKKKLSPDKFAKYAGSSIDLLTTIANIAHTIPLSNREDTKIESGRGRTSKPSNTTRHGEYFFLVFASHR